MDIEPAGEAVKLTVTHSMDREGSKLIESVSGGWPLILSNLKSLLETGLGGDGVPPGGWTEVARAAWPGPQDDQRPAVDHLVPSEAELAADQDEVLA